MSEAVVPSVSDGHTTIRAPEAGDAARLIAGRDAEFHRFMGEGSPDPKPSAVILSGAEVVGWVDYDPEPDWLPPGHVNVGYNVFASHRGRGHASRAVQLLMHHLALDGSHGSAVLLIRKDNQASLALAHRLGFELTGPRDDSLHFVRPVPDLHYTDGLVSIRRRTPSDLDDDLAAKDAEQQRWLWEAEDRRRWASLDTAAQRAHALKHLNENYETFGRGPKWTFSIDTLDAPNVGYIDCDLANENLGRAGVSFGEANISYSAHPDHRGRGYISRAARLIVQFLAEHTGAQSAHLAIEGANRASLRVAEALGAEPRGTFSTLKGVALAHYAMTIHRARPTAGASIVIS